MCFLPNPTFTRNGQADLDGHQLTAGTVETRQQALCGRLVYKFIVVGWIVNVSCSCSHLDAAFGQGIEPAHSQQQHALCQGMGSREASSAEG